LAAAVFLAVASPFNAVTYLPFAARLAYWAGLVALALYVARIFDGVLVRRRPGVGLKWRALAASVAAAPVVWAVILAVQTLIDRAVPTHFWVQLLGCVWVICLPLCLAASFTSPQVFEAGSATGAALQPPRTNQARPLGLPEGATVFAVSAEDHYVRVHTDLGETLVLMRFRDAVEGVAGRDGLQVHRSWWIAKAGVAAIRRRNGRLQVELKSGACAPVSKAGAKALRAASWTSWKR
jgi:DNA-binding LytR/AlgR family response regulator